MRSRALALFPVLLLQTGCGFTLRGGAGVRSVGEELNFDAHGTVGAGLGTAHSRTQLLLPLTLGTGAFEAGPEFSHTAENGLGYRVSARYGTELSGRDGGFLSLRGGPMFAFTEIEKEKWVPVLMLDLTAGVGTAGDIRSQGIFGASLTFGWDQYNEFSFNLPSGRALRDAMGAAWKADVAFGDACEATTLRSTRRGAAMASLPARIRDAVGAAWLEEALAEHASIASFTRLAHELHALGATDALVLRAAWAAREELGHARACLQIAERYLGREIRLSRLPAAMPRRISRAELALECWLDGCVGEGAAWRFAALRARHASAPRVRGVLRTVAREERAHAALAWDIIEWAREDRDFAHVLEDAIERWPEHSTSSDVTSSASLADHGVLPTRVLRECLEQARTEARARLRSSGFPPCGRCS